MRRLGAAGAGALASCLSVFLLFEFSAPSAQAAHSDIPILGKFLLSTAWNGDALDGAMRSKNRWAGFHFAGVVGYMKDRELKFSEEPDCAFDPMKHPVTRLPAAFRQGLLSGSTSSSEGDT